MAKHIMDDLGIDPNTFRNHGSTNSYGSVHAEPIFGFVFVVMAKTIHFMPGGKIYGRLGYRSQGERGERDHPTLLLTTHITHPKVREVREITLLFLAHN